MTYEAVLKDLKAGKYYPVYFFHGEEPFYIDLLSDYISSNVLSDLEKEFNQTILYGKDTDGVSVVSYAKRYPMMSNHQVVIIREAQELKNIEALTSYVENPLSSTILVFCYKYKSLDKRLKFSKTIASKGVVVESKKLYDNQVPDWVVQYLSGKQYKIQPRAAALLSEYLGNDLSKIGNELDKLILNLAGEKEITVKHIEDNIGISKEYNVFELHNALSKKEVLKANQIINYFAANPKNNPLIMTIASLYGYFSKILVYHGLEDKSKSSVASALKISPFFTGDYEAAARAYPLGKSLAVIGMLKEYDLRSKGVDNGSSDDGELLKELVFKILH